MAEGLTCFRLGIRLVDSLQLTVFGNEDPGENRGLFFSLLFACHSEQSEESRHRGGDSQRLYP
jgi:hypothetical protein